MEKLPEKLAFLRDDEISFIKCFVANDFSDEKSREKRQELASGMAKRAENLYLRGKNKGARYMGLVVFSALLDPSMPKYASELHTITKEKDEKSRFVIAKLDGYMNLLSPERRAYEEQYYYAHCAVISRLHPPVIGQTHQLPEAKVPETELYCFQTEAHLLAIRKPGERYLQEELNTALNKQYLGDTSSANAKRGKEALRTLQYYRSSLSNVGMATAYLKIAALTRESSYISQAFSVVEKLKNDSEKQEFLEAANEMLKRLGDNPREALYVMRTKQALRQSSLQQIVS